MKGFALVEVGRCPVCGGSEREPTDGMSVARGRQLQGLYYLRPVAAELGITVEEFTEQAKSYKCLGCGNFYCDPWLNPELSSAIFNAQGPDHLFAWTNFEIWLHRRPPFRTNELLYEIVLKRVGRIATYAEFGCPFQGFLMRFRQQEATPSQRLSLFSRALRRPPDARWMLIPRLYNAAQRWLGRLAVMSLRSRGFLVLLQEKLRGSGGADRSDATVLPMPKQRYLLTRDTHVGWGSNCVRYGASCRYFAHTVLGAHVLPMEDVYARGGLTFDLIGIFNTLDHTSFPLDVVRKSLQLARHVLLVTHHARHAGKQHSYAFGDDFARWLETSLDDVSAVDLYREIEPATHDNNYILLSRRTPVT